jgi:NAD-dependent deacetylase
MQRKEKLVFLTGAGVSAESGVSTFRDSDGLWENYPVMDVCSADGFRRNPALVHQFYNERRRQLLTVEPNAAHRAIAELEQYFDVRVVTQNVDDLHERAGTPVNHIIHLHGELMKVRSLVNPNHLFTLTPDNLDTTPETRINGEPVRPHIVFFQEPVPMLEAGAEEVSRADILVVIGTSLVVYPAAGLINMTKPGARVYYIDPHPAAVPTSCHVIQNVATAGMAELKSILLRQ